LNPYLDDIEQQRLRQQISQYYRLHSRIYDSTRWTFLFGRKYLIAEADRKIRNPERITEFGSGTGKNLLLLAKHFPTAMLTGIDLSAEMLLISKRKTHSIKSKLNLVSGMDFSCLQEMQDLIIFSYCLSMINPGWRHVIVDALSMLKPGGIIAVVDFHASPLGLYRSFMHRNHVSLSAEIYPFLKQHTNTLHEQKHSAYFGTWSYFTYLGTRKT
jgi:S-adenosylmethionine-diacylgycerolhomoserine-N-methlytransferase